MNLALTGYRGSGKTSISNALSILIGWEKVEIDKEIEKTFNMKIPQIINVYGWKEFRLCEFNLIKEYSKYDNLVLDLGGGAILNEDNMKNIKNNGIIIFLNCHPAILIERLKNSKIRPPLTNLNLAEEVITTLFERITLYLKYADYSINTGYRSITECTFQIFSLLLYSYKLLRINDGLSIFKPKQVEMLINKNIFLMTKEF